MQQNASTEQEKPARKSKQKPTTLPGSHGRPHKYAPIPVEIRAQIVERSLPKISKGITLAQIAIDEGITVPALHGYLMATGDEYQSVREAYIQGLLIEARMALETAGTEHEEENIPRAQLSFARAREQMRYAQFIAERRDARYAAKQEVTQVSISITAALALANGRVIDSE